MGIELKEGALARYRETYEWAEQYGLKDKFLKGWRQLDNFGRAPDGSNTCRADVWPDFAPHSFGFQITFLASGMTIAGALIYQGPEQPADGSGPSFSVSLHDDVGWFMHT